MKPSPYQAAIYQWIEDGRGDAVISAVAGSGKTTTIVAAAALASGRRLFLAFNKAIAEELAKRLPADVAASTIHSAGYAALRAGSRTRYRLEGSKARDLVRDMLDEKYGQVARDADADERDERRDAEAACTQLLDKSRLSLVDCADRHALADLAYRHGIIATPDILDVMPAILARSCRLAERGVIDFVDMLYLPVAWQLQPATYDFIFIDEAQDLSPVQLALVLKMRAPGGRIVAVGDRSQAIYGFAGADPQSIDRIIAATSAVELPLSICYRCPLTHLDLARELVPTIEPAPGQVAGQVAAISADQLPKVVKNGDLILCRLTAPLISACIQLIAAKVPARVRGRDVAKTLTSAVQDIAKRPGFTWQNFAAAIADYRNRQVAKASRRKDADAATEALEDRIAGILAVADAYECDSADSLCRAIESLFADDAASVWLSTIHRAKGLEAPRVFILRPEKLPLVRPNMLPWQIEQEQNLLYVALTRCKADAADESSGILTYVLTDAPAQPDADALAG